MLPVEGEQASHGTHEGDEGEPARQTPGTRGPSALTWQEGIASVPQMTNDIPRRMGLRFEGPGDLYAEVQVSIDPETQGELVNEIDAPKRTLASGTQIIEQLYTDVDEIVGEMGSSSHEAIEE